MINRYPAWLYFALLCIVSLATLYAAPNLYPNVPAVYISASKSHILPTQLQEKVENILKKENIIYKDITWADHMLCIRFTDTEQQMRSKDILSSSLDQKKHPLSLNLVSAKPKWMKSINALPMQLGLDLRGGVHFLMAVDVDVLYGLHLQEELRSLRTLFRQKHMTSKLSIRRDELHIYTQKAAAQLELVKLMQQHAPDFELLNSIESLDDMLRDENSTLRYRLSPVTARKILNDAVQQNIMTLSNRINELGVAEPVIRQQGDKRIVVQLPGVQDIAKAKNILGRTATLEIRLVEDIPIGTDIPVNVECLTEKNVHGHSSRVCVNKMILLTGEHLTRADAGYTQENLPAVMLRFDSVGSRIFYDLTSQNVGKRMAILLVEDGQREVVTSPRINESIPGGRVQISGSFTVNEAAELSLLLRSGTLAAPMTIIEEHTIGPSLGADNIQRGVQATLWGLIGIAIFIILYYGSFGAISVLALIANLLLLVALLSILQATLTLPGIAAIALTLGMAIDANVLINERIREELRAGMPPRVAIHEGYDKAFSTIVDSNITTLLAGIALLTFGSSAVRGFAIVHCLGIVTSMFSSVVLSRALVNLLYGHGRQIKNINIGQTYMIER